MGVRTCGGVGWGSTGSVVYVRCGFGWGGYLGICVRSSN